MSRRQRSRGGPVEVTRPLGIVATGRRRGLRVTMVSQDGREGVELRHVALSPTAAVAPLGHRTVVPLTALAAVVALLAGVKTGEKP